MTSDLTYWKNNLTNSLAIGKKSVDITDRTKNKRKRQTAFLIRKFQNIESFRAGFSRLFQIRISVSQNVDKAKGELLTE